MAARIRAMEKDRKALLDAGRNAVIEAAGDYYQSSGPFSIRELWDSVGAAGSPAYAAITAALLDMGFKVKMAGGGSGSKQGAKRIFWVEGGVLNGVKAFRGIPDLD